MVLGRIVRVLRGALERIEDERLTWPAEALLLRVKPELARVPLMTELERVLVVKLPKRPLSFTRRGELEADQLELEMTVTGRVRVTSVLPSMPRIFTTTSMAATGL